MKESPQTADVRQAAKPAALKTAEFETAKPGFGARPNSN